LDINFTFHALPHLLLGCVSFPSLKSLSFRCCRHSLDALTSCIRHCSPPLTHLEIADYDNGMDHSPELSRLLWLAPTITHLTLRCFPVTDAFFQHFRTPVCANLGSKEQQFLPCLTSFNFDSGSGPEEVPFSWKSLSESLLSRFKNSDSLQWPLRTLNIDVAPEPSNNGHFLVEGAVAGFEELMEYGVQVQLRNCYDGGYEGDMIAYSKAFHQSRKAEVELT